MGFPRLANWEADDGRQALFQVGTTVLEVRGRSRSSEPGGRDEAFDYQGPDQKLTLEIVVASAEAAYQELLFRDPNIPGGLSQDASGALLFGTHDPDGVKIVFRQLP